MTQNPRQKKIRPKPDNAQQSRAFIEKAREIEADESQSKADALLGSLAKMKPEPRMSSKDKKLR